jgi:hypothetical protein
MVIVQRQQVGLPGFEPAARAWHFGQCGLRQEL